MQITIENYVKQEKRGCLDILFVITDSVVTNGIRGEDLLMVFFEIQKIWEGGRYRIMKGLCNNGRRSGFKI